MRRTCLVAALLAALASPASGEATQKPPRSVYLGDSDFPPYEFADPQGQPAGFNVELVRALGREAGIDIEIRLMIWHDVVATFEAGRADLVSYAYSDARAAACDFLARTWTLHQSLVFLPGRDSYPADLLSIAAEVVAVEDRSLIHDLIRDVPEARRPSLLALANQPAALRALDAGEATAVAGNELTLRLAASRLARHDLVSVGVKAFGYHLTARKGRAAEFTWVAPALARMKESGEFDHIVERHLTWTAAPLTWPVVLRRVAVIGVPALAIGLAIVAWNLSLRRQVRQRTEELSRSLSTAEGLNHELAESEGRFRQMAETIDAVFWMTDRDRSRLVYVSPAVEALLGVPPQRFPSTPRRGGTSYTRRMRLA